MILYEPAIVHDGRFLIRVDVFEKSGNHINLIEVKAKSVDSGTDFYNSRDGSIKADWLPYLMDVAFQYWVMSQAHPEWTVTPWLMLVDKDATATVDGLYQHQEGLAGDSNRQCIAEGDILPTIHREKLREPDLVSGG